MTLRTCKLLGQAWGDPAAPVRLTVSWKGQQVFDGAVPTVGAAPDATTTEYQALCTWQVPSEDTGLIPLQLTCYNGSVLFHNIVINNIVHTNGIVLNPDAVWPKHTPADWEDFRLDIEALSESEFLALYGFPASDAQNYTVLTSVPAADNWVDGNFNNQDANGFYTDGKSNVALNGVLLPLDPPKTKSFETNYFFRSGDTLSLDYLMEWDI